MTKKVYDYSLIEHSFPLKPSIEKGRVNQKGYCQSIIFHFEIDEKCIHFENETHVNMEYPLFFKFWNKNLID